MKLTKRAMPSWLGLTIVVAIAMTVIGAGVLSNVLTITNHVRASPGILTQVNVAVGTDTYYGKVCTNLPLGEGTISTKIMYITGIKLTSSATLGNVVVKYNITKTGILTTDLTVQYGNPTGANTLLTMTLTQSDTNALTGTFIVPDPVTATYDKTLVVFITYNTPGDYVITAWLETV